MRVEQVTDPVAYHGEGPVWSARWGGLCWGGGAVIGVEQGFVLEASDGSLTPLPELWSGDEVRMNEGGCDQRPGAARLYRLDADLNVEVVLEGVTVSNGLEWSPDGARAYYNDMATRQISVFDYDPEAGLTGRRTFAEIPGEGRPDGLTVDAEGGVWTAIANGGAVHRYTPDGRLDEVITVPARKVTSCTFGGEQLNELFITTSREGLPEGEDSLASSLFRASPQVAGRCGSSPGDRPARHLRRDRRPHRPVPAREQLQQYGGEPSSTRVR